MSRTEEHAAEPVRPSWGWVWWVLAGFATIMALVALLGALQPDADPDIGTIPVDDDTEYVLLERLSTAGGVCDGLQAVKVGIPRKETTSGDRLLCWRREGDRVAVLAPDGRVQSFPFFAVRP